MSGHDDDPPGAISARVALRLLGFARPHARLFLIAAALVALTTLADLAAPWLTKLAIDRCLLPPLTVVDPHDPFLDSALVAAGGRRLADGGVVVERADLPKPVAEEVERRKLRRGLYFPLPPRLPVPQAAGILHDHGIALIPAEAVGALPDAQRAALHRPQLRELRSIALVLLGVVAARLVTAYIQGLLLQRAGNRVMSDLRERVVGHLLRLPMPYFERNPVGRLVTRATNDVAAVNEVFTSVLVYLLKDALSLLGAAAILLALDWRLALAVFAFAPAVAAISWRFRGRAAAAYRAGRRALSDLNAHLQESVAGARAVKLGAQEERMRGAFAAVNRREYDAGMVQVRLYGVYMPAIALVGTLALAAVLWRGSALVAGGGLTVGALVAFVGYIDVLFAPLRDLAEKHNVVQAAGAAGERIFQVLDEPAEPAGGERPARVDGRVEFEDVWFSYDPAAAQPVWALAGASFAIEPGRRLALVGPTGSGKTTLAALLLRFREPQRGRIRLDGRDLRELDLAWLRRRFALVLQDVLLFAGSVADNLALKDPDAQRARLEAAARTVGVDAAISRMPGGYDAALGEGGSGLSSGERQLLAFARALAAEPAVLILDEATASVDSHTEQLVQAAMERLLEGRTSITIAHRLSTIRRADLILVLRHGAIVERGTHEQLLGHGGLYAALVRRQEASEKAGGRESLSR